MQSAGLREGATAPAAATSAATAASCLSLREPTTVPELPTVMCDGAMCIEEWMWDSFGWIFIPLLGDVGLFSRTYLTDGELRRYRLEARFFFFFYYFYQSLTIIAS